MAGFKDDSAFLMDISEEEAMAMAKQAAETPPEDDANTKAAKVLAEVEREKAQMKLQSDMAKLELQREQMELKAAKEMLAIQQERAKFEQEMAMKELELAQKTANDDQKNNLNQSRELITALDKISNLSQRGI